MLAALTEALKHNPSAEYEIALKKLLDFVANFMADPSDGVLGRSRDDEGKIEKRGEGPELEGELPRRTCYGEVR